MQASIDQESQKRPLRQLQQSDVPFFSSSSNAERCLRSFSVSIHISSYFFIFKMTVLIQISQSHLVTRVMLLARREFEDLVLKCE